MRARIGILALLAVACGEPLSPPPAQFSHSAATQGLETFFGPVTVTRTTGAPNSAPFIVSTAGFAAPFVLVATSSSGAAWVDLDGENVVGPGAFRNGGTVEDTVVLQDGAALELRIAGTTGATLTVRIEARPAATRFCPADVGDGASFADFPAAIAATEPGGTIVVCDGTHEVNDVIVDRPLTIRAETPLGATLTNPTGQTSFTVGGVAAGTVRFTGMRFVNRRFASISAPQTMTWDQVVVDSNAFVGIGNATAGVFAGASSVPGALVTVRQNDFQNLLVGTFAAGATRMDVLGNTLEGMIFGGIQYQLGASGRAIDNRIDGCGPAHCIAMLGAANAPAASVEIVGNRVTTPPIPGGGIEVTNWSGGVFNLSGNQLAVVTPAPDPSDPATLGFGAAAVAIRLPTNSSAVVRIDSNTVENADIGFRVEGPPSISGVDNILRTLNIGIQAGGAQRFTRNDVVNAFTSLVSTAADLTCNWWGSPAGPVNLALGTPVAVYTPFAQAPIARTTEVCP